MRITTVSYRRLRSFGNYENESVEATMEVVDGESPELALDELRSWVMLRLGRREELDRLNVQIINQRHELQLVQRLCSDARRYHAAAKKVLAPHGIELPDFEEAVQKEIDDLKDLPF